MGEEDAGKTCLGDSFFDTTYVENQPSTKGIKMNTMVQKVVVGHTQWKRVNEEEHITVLDRMFVKEVDVRKQAQTPFFPDAPPTAPPTAAPSTASPAASPVAFPIVVHAAALAPALAPVAPPAAAAAAVLNDRQKSTATQRNSINSESFMICHTFSEAIFCC